MKTTYNHAFDIGFSVAGCTSEDAEQVSASELRKALLLRLADLDDDEMLEACGAAFDSYEEDDRCRAERAKVMADPEARLKAALVDAEAAFYAMLTAHYPEITSGDLDPGTEISFTETAEATARTWVHFNTPEMTMASLADLEPSAAPEQA